MQEPMTSRARASLLGEHRRLAHSPIPVQNNREAEVHLHWKDENELSVGLR